MVKYLFLLLFNAQLLAAQNYPGDKIKPFVPGEKLFYRVEYSVFNAAEGYLHVQEEYKSVSGKDTYWFSAYGYTVGLFDKIIRMRDRYDVYSDTSSLLPYIYRDDIQEGSYTRKGFSIFDYDSMQVKSRKGVFKIESLPVVDVLSIFYYMRTFDVDSSNYDSIYAVTCFLEDDFFKVGVKFRGIDMLETDYGMIECMRFNPIIPAGDIFEEKENATLWITNDKNKIPVRAEADIIIGTIKFELMRWENLKYEFDALNKF